MQISAKIAFIGGGNMATALIKGLISSKTLSPEELIASDPNPAQRERLSQSFGIAVTGSNAEALKESGAAVLAVKPQVASRVLQELAADEKLLGGKTLISIVAGLSTDAIAGFFVKKPEWNPPRIIRVMPNTPALVGAGAAAVCKGETATESDLSLALALFESVGCAVQVPESLMDAVTGLSGSGPAYVFLAIQALADAGVRMGLPRETALKLTVQTVLGSAKMVQETHLHPEALKDQVCSPGGTTIAGVYALEKAGVRAAFHEAVESAALRSGELGKKR